MNELDSLLSLAQPRFASPFWAVDQRAVDQTGRACQRISMDRWRVLVPCRLLALFRTIQIIDGRCSELHDSSHCPTVTEQEQAEMHG